MNPSASIHRLTSAAFVLLAATFCTAPGSAAAATDTAGNRTFHVAAAQGDDANDGTSNNPFKTISAAANIAQPGDVITVHAGIYRERVSPPRGGESDAKRITYQAAPGEKVVITGSEPVKGWEKVGNDTWKVTIPNSYFGEFNPYAEKVHGDWFFPEGRVHHRGCVYLGNDGLTEAVNLDTVLEPAGENRLWFAKVDGVVGPVPPHLMNVAWFKTATDSTIPAANPSARSGTMNAPCSEGGQCVGWISQNNWLRFDGVDFGAGTETIEVRAAAIAGAGGSIELRLDSAEGELLGICAVDVTGDWQKWRTFTAKIKKTAGKKNLCMVFKPHAVDPDADDTTIWAQFPGVNPNEAGVEISVRPTVFTPEKTNIDFITLRGFELKNAATNWAAPTAGQVGLVTAYWCKGWIIENNEIHHSRCSGIALGKYSDQWDGKRGTTNGYYLTIDDALKKDGWTKEKIGSHIVRNNHIHHCGQTGIVGSMGCAFSRIEGNEIHDINLGQNWSGFEMAAIKFHAPIDVVIADNHLYRFGPLAGIWLDWMTQGTQITGNLLHSSAATYGDIFTEVNHGPFLLANNIILSTHAYYSNSQGGAYAHNLMAGGLRIGADRRKTPYHKPHSTEMVELHGCPLGDLRWHNNVFATTANLGTVNGASWPVTASGNVFTKGTQASKFDQDALRKPDFDPGLKLEQKPDGWYLTITADETWRDEVKRKLVTTELLGKAKIPDQKFENADGSPIHVDTDYFGNKRDPNNPFPGPFEITTGGTQTLKVWPKK